jgi:hypothetical protein
VGLDAVVYRNINNLELKDDRLFAQVDPQTGEIYFDNAEISKKYRDKLCAAGHRLGNIAEISALREEIMKLIGPTSKIIQAILYSGTHTGDFITLNSLPALATELSTINKVGQPSPELVQFLTSMNDLIRVAAQEGNPIVFT